jgi:hypothetical protein
LAAVRSSLGMVGTVARRAGQFTRAAARDRRPAPPPTAAGPAVADTRVHPSVDTGFNLGMACPVDGARAA